MRNDGDPDSRFCIVGFWICFEGRALNLYYCFFKKVFCFFSWAGNMNWTDSIIAL